MNSGTATGNAAATRVTPVTPTITIPEITSSTGTLAIPGVFYPTTIASAGSGSSAAIVIRIQIMITSGGVATATVVSGGSARLEGDGRGPKRRRGLQARTTSPSGGAFRLAAVNSRDALPTATPSEGISFSLVANGNPSGEAFQLQVLDPTGKVKKIDMPEGVALEPLQKGTAKPVAAAGQGNVLTKQITAYCVEFSKLPPEPDMLYRIAPPAIQEKYKPLRTVLQAGRKLAAAGQFHPDSDPQAYANFIRQYAVWSKIENWDQQKFAEMYIEKTRQNAQAMKVKWTKEIEKALRAAVPGRWNDISQVLEEDRKLEQATPAVR